MIESIFYGTFLGRDRLSPARIGYLLLIWVLIPFWLVIRLTTMVIGFFFTQGLTLYFQQLDVNHQPPVVSFTQPFLTWTGDIGVHDLRIQPAGDDGSDHVLKASQVLIDLPNLGALSTVSAFNKRPNSDPSGMKDVGFIDRIDHVGLAIEGLQADSVDNLPDVLGHFGLASAAPFEAEGCKRDRSWLGTDLIGMGVGGHGVDLRLTFDTDAKTGEVRLQGNLDSPNSSKVAFAQNYRAPNLSTLLAGGDAARINTYERIAVTDAGFTRARNIYCAKRDGITEPEFVDRHVSAVQRRLQATGMHAGADVEHVYREYLARGSLLIEAKPSATVRRADYDQYSIADQQRLYNAQISAGGAPVPLVLEAVAARPIPTAFSGSTWDLMAQETAVPETTSPDSAAASPATSTAAAPLPATAAPKPTPVAAAAPAPQRASSLPAAAATRRQPTTLSFDDLGQHLGERVLITTVFGDVRDVSIDSCTKQEVIVRAYVIGGYMTQHISRAQIRSIRTPY